MNKKILIVTVIILLILSAGTSLYFWYVRGYSFFKPAPQELRRQIAMIGPESQEPGLAKKVFEQWEIKKDMPTQRTEVAVASLKEKIYVIGGFDGFGRTTAIVEVYDPKTDSWSQAPDLPQPRHHAMAAVLEDKLYVIGGFSNLRFKPEATVFVFDPEKNMWEQKSPMPEARGAGAAVSFQEKIYVFAGQTLSGDTNEILIYDPKSDQWQRGIALKGVARDHLAAAVVGEKIYIIGGRRGSLTSNIATLDIYDPLNNQVELGPPMITPRGGIAAAQLSGKIYVFGGEESTKTFSANEEYHPEMGSWRKALPMPTARHGLGAATVGDKIYVIGGGTHPGLSVSGANEAYSITLGIGKEL